MGIFIEMSGKSRAADYCGAGAWRHIGKRLDRCAERNCDSRIYWFDETEIRYPDGCWAEFCRGAADVSNQQLGCRYNI